MPSRDLECNHDKFVDDQSGERDRHNVKEFGFEK